MAELNELLKRWPHMPDDAVSPTKLTCAVTGLSQKSVRYDPRLPRVYLSKNRYGQRVRDVRRVLSGDLRGGGAS
jgi:hypothetical protein